jgi:hypothetical protein
MRQRIAEIAGFAAILFMIGVTGWCRIDMLVRGLYSVPEWQAYHWSHHTPMLYAAIVESIMLVTFVAYAVIWNIKEHYGK